MEIAYSSLEVIERYDLIHRELYMVENQHDLNTYYRNLIDLIGGLGLTNSMHEKFVKSILADYSRIYNLSRRKKNQLVKKYKAPQSIEKFADDLQLDLVEAFNLEKRSIQDRYAYILDVNNLFSIISEQRVIRNSYLHGDFNFTDVINYELYYQQVLQFQEIHNFIFKIFRYSYINNVNELPLLF